jgi:hypothetical protein
VSNRVMTKGAGWGPFPGWSTRLVSLGLATVVLLGCDGDPVLEQGADPGPSSLPAPGEMPGAGSGAAVETPVPAPSACGVRLTELAAYQAVKIPLLDGEGLPVQGRNAPLIEGRRALVRAFVALPPGSGGGHAAARLLLSSGENSHTYREIRLLDRDSTDDTLDSTFIFDVEAQHVRADTRLHVELETGADCADGVLRRFPSEGGVALAPRLTGTLKIVLVPVRYEADGSGRMPDVSQDQLQLFHDILMAVYPTNAIELRVREATSTSITLGGTTGWDKLLDAIRELRFADRAPADVFYYGLVSPSTSFRAYCRGACTAGLSYLAESHTPSRQVGLGVGFSGQVAADTLSHELGHQHGRSHAPCGTSSGLDRRYPYENGVIGGWGFDFRTMQLQSPSRKDFMGYCSPHWISDYSFSALAERRALVSTSFERPASPIAARRFRALLVEGSGRSVWGRPLYQAEVPTGTPETARVLDSAGRVLAEVTVYRTVYGDGPGASLLVPPAEPGWAAIDVAGATPLSYTAPVAVPALEPLRPWPKTLGE